MKLGIFDHLDRNDVPLPRFYEERLQLIEAADAAGIDSYHLAEHHWNPVGMAPLPGVFLGAAASRTKRIRLGPLAYALAFHDPLILAEEVAMLDQMSNGRLELGVGRGISPWELSMYGITMNETRDIFREAMEVMIQYFTQDRVNHRGHRWRYLDVPVELKPIQKPFPPLMNAGSSGKGRDFAAKYADMAFLHLDPSNLDSLKAHIDSYRRLARDDYGRELQIWANCHVTQRDTQKEADAYLHHYVVEDGDDEAVENILKIQGQQMQRLQLEQREQLKFNIKAGWGGYPLVGTADRIVDQLTTLSGLGIDGILLSWVDYLDGLDRWQRDVMPRLEQAGLRKPVSASGSA